MTSQKEFSQNLIDDIVDLFDESPDKGVKEAIYSCIYTFVQNYNITSHTNESMGSRDETIVNKPKKEKKLKSEKKIKKSKENDEDESVEVEEPVKKTKKSDEEELVKKTKKSSKIEEEPEVEEPIKKSTKFKKTDGFVLFSTKNKDKLKGSGKVKKLQEMWGELTDGERETFELDAS